MLEIKGNAWDLAMNYDALCITTNGTVKGNGECVMGRGIALECKQRHPEIPLKLGKLIRQYGNRVMILKRIPKNEYSNLTIISFPVKHNWWENADISLIRKSCNQLIDIAIKYNFDNVLIPRPGCGNGKLKWTDVKPVLEELLDDRFTIISF